MKTRLLIIGLICTGIMMACAPKQEAEPIENNATKVAEVPDMTDWTDSAKLAYYYHQIYPNGDFGKYDKAVVIREGKRCPTCDKRFARGQEMNVNDTNTLFIVAALGILVDISPYVDIPRDNVIWDTMLLFDDINMVDSSMVFDLK